MWDSHAYTDSIPHFNSNGNGDADTDGHANRNGNSNGNTNSYANTDSYANCDAHANTNTNTNTNSHSHAHTYTDSDGNANRHLPGNLYDSYYHWHHNRRRHRYRQPLRRLHHGHHSTLPGKRIRQSAGYSGGCRVGRRHTLPRALQQTVLVDGVRAGGSGDWTGSVPEYLLP